MDCGRRHWLQVLAMCGEVVPISAAKACSGKCQGTGCGVAPRTWIIAACEGMVSLFTKEASGSVVALKYAPHGVFATLEQFQQSLDDAAHEKKFDQLVIVGSKSDIAWVYSALPGCAFGHIAAEINYPLLASWFKEQTPMPHLSQALQGVLAN